MSVNILYIIIFIISSSCFNKSKNGEKGRTISIINSSLKKIEGKKNFKSIQISTITKQGDRILQIDGEDILPNPEQNLERLNLTHQAFTLKKPVLRNIDGGKLELLKLKISKIQTSVFIGNYKGKKIVCKIFYPEKDKRISENDRNEIETYLKIFNHNKDLCPEIYSLFKDLEGKVYLIMEELEELNYDKLLNNMKFYIVKTVENLIEIEKLGIELPDIKPGNLFLPKFIDFDINKNNRSIFFNTENGIKLSPMVSIARSLIYIFLMDKTLKIGDGYIDEIQLNNKEIKEKFKYFIQKIGFEKNESVIPEVLQNIKNIKKMGYSGKAQKFIQSKYFDILLNALDNKYINTEDLLKALKKIK